MSKEKNTTPIEAQETPVASDLVRTEEQMLEILGDKYQPQWMVEEVQDLENSPEMGKRWTMQKAMCLMWTLRPETHVAEVAYVIARVFDKPNYGLARAKTDLRKYKNGAFKCMYLPTENEETAESGEDEVDTAVNQ